MTKFKIKNLPQQYVVYVLLISYLLYSHELLAQTHYKIMDMGYVSIPKEMELDEGNVREVSDQSLSALLNKYNQEIVDKKIVFLQKDLIHNDEVDTKLLRASFTIVKDTQDLDLENMDQLQIENVSDSIRSAFTKELEKEKMKIISWYGIQKIIFNNETNALKLSYIKQDINKVKIMINTYWVYKNSKKYILTCSYKRQEQNKWKPVYNQILKSIYID